MTERKTAGSLDFEALRLGIERCNPDLVIGFYADDAQLSIVNADGAPHTSPFELRGKAEIAKHLRTTFGSGSSHRIEGEVVGEDRVTFRETSEYPDGDRVRVETMLKVRDGKIFRQVDAVTNGVQAGDEREVGRRLLTRKPNREPAQGRMRSQPAISHDARITDGKEGTRPAGGA
jgi:hypothetical protein